MLDRVKTVHTKPVGTTQHGVGDVNDPVDGMHDSTFRSMEHQTPSTPTQQGGQRGG